LQLGVPKNSAIRTWPKLFAPYGLAEAQGIVEQVRAALVALVPGTRMAKGVRQRKPFEAAENAAI